MKTVEVHRHNVLSKLEVQTLVEVYQLVQAAETAGKKGRCLA